MSAQKRSEKILVVGPSWVGDMVMAQVLFIHLQKHNPGAVIDVLAPPWSSAILERMPQVRRAIPLPIGHGELGLRKRWRLGRSLRKEGYAQSILLPNSLKSALVPMFARIPLRTGWCGEQRYGLLNDLRHLDEQAMPLMVQRFAALGQSSSALLPAKLPAPCLVVDEAQAEHCREAFSLRPDRPILALCPGAEFGGAKRWPEHHYASVAREYLGRGWQVVLYGSKNDQPVTSAIRAAAGDHDACIDLAGRTTLAEAVDMLSLSEAVISNDSGLMHVAAALSRPMVVIYGPTSPGFTPPLNDNAAMIVSDIDCAPCFTRECPLGHHRCMQDARPEQVTAKLDALLAVGEGT